MYEYAQSESPTINQEQLNRENQLRELSYELKKEKKEAQQFEQLTEQLRHQIKLQLKQNAELEEEMKHEVAEFKKQQDIFKILDAQVEQRKQSQHYQKNIINPSQEKIDPSKYRKKKSDSSPKKKEQIKLKSKDFYDF